MEEILKKRLSAAKAKALARFGWSFAAGMAILTAVGVWKNFPAWAVWSSGILCHYHLLAFLLFRKALVPTFVAVGFVGKVVGFLVSCVVFAVVYYALFAPIAWCLRLAKKDLIGRAAHRPAWVDIPADFNDPARLRKLF